MTQVQVVDQLSHENETSLAIQAYLLGRKRNRENSLDLSRLFTRIKNDYYSGASKEAFEAFWIKADKQGLGKLTKTPDGRLLAFKLTVDVHSLKRSLNPAQGLSRRQVRVATKEAAPAKPTPKAQDRREVITYQRGDGTVRIELTSDMDGDTLARILKAIGVSHY